jgi:ribosome-binding factor A
MRRVNHEIRNAVSEILLNEIKDPRVGFVTVVHVEVSKDLQRAEVYVSVLSDDPKTVSDTLDALEKAKGYIRTLVGQRVVIKYLPEIRFHLHEGARHAVEIDQILRGLSEKEGSSGL